MADELIYMFSTLSIIKEINSVNCKGYVKKKLEIKLEQTCDISMQFVIKRKIEKKETE